MDQLKFCGKNKKESMRRAIFFYYDNFQDLDLYTFLAKCRLQKDGSTIIYYHNMKADPAVIKQIKEKKKGKNNG